jgi:hypothetical protein
LASFHKIEVLLQLHVDLLGLLLVFIHDFCQTLVIGLLLLLLLLLGAEGYADIAVVVDCFLQAVRLFGHLLLLFVYFASQFVVVTLSTNIIFLWAIIVSTERGSK